MCSEGQPSVSAYIQNLREPMPLPRKMWLVARNVWRRIVRRSDCCGHPGEPGC